MVQRDRMILEGWSDDRIAPQVRADLRRSGIHTENGMVTRSDDRP